MEEEEGRKQLTVPIEVVIGRHISISMCLFPVYHLARVYRSHGCSIGVVLDGIRDRREGSRGCCCSTRERAQVFVKKFVAAD